MAPARRKRQPPCHGDRSRRMRSTLSQQSPRRSSPKDKCASSVLPLSQFEPLRDNQHWKNLPSHSRLAVKDGRASAEVAALDQVLAAAAVAVAVTRVVDRSAARQSPAADCPAGSWPANAAIHLSRSG